MDDLTLLLWATRAFVVLMTLLVVALFVGCWWVIAGRAFAEFRRGWRANDLWLPFLPNERGEWGPLVSIRWWSAARAPERGTTSALAWRWGFWMFSAVGTDGGCGRRGVGRRPNARSGLGLTPGHSDRSHRSGPRLGPPRHPRRPRHRPRNPHRQRWAPFERRGNGRDGILAPEGTSPRYGRPEVIAERRAGCSLAGLSASASLSFSAVSRSTTPSWGDRHRRCDPWGGRRISPPRLGPWLNSPATTWPTSPVSPASTSPTPSSTRWSVSWASSSSPWQPSSSRPSRASSR